jgi:hypothetical protein
MDPLSAKSSPVLEGEAESELSPLWRVHEISVREAYIDGALQDAAEQLGRGQHG